ncbi:MAG: PD-(D/E)XK nuclease family protein [Akkermansiaceae bacterium]
MPNDADLEPEFDFSEPSSVIIEPNEKSLLHPKREFLGWDRPLLDVLKDWLFYEPRREFLSQTLVIVPTSNSGRRLRLALSADEGVLSPHVMPPSSLFAVDTHTGNIASRQESLWAWASVIRDIDLREFPILFPNHDVGSTRSFSAALALAKQMMTLRDMLADGDAEFKDAQEHSIESDRWHELEKLENRMLQCLDAWGLLDSVHAKRQQARHPVLPAGVDRVVLACVPDPTLLAARALQSFLDRGVPVTVLIHAPESESISFDPWGIPLSEMWSKMPITIPEWRQRLHVVDSSTEAAEVCAQVFSHEETNSDAAALALCDPTFASALEKTFHEAGWSLFDPEGRNLLDSGVMRFIRVMRQLIGRSEPFDALCELVKLPGAEWILPEGLSRHEAALILDDLRLKHLPETMTDALYLIPKSQKFIVEKVLGQLKSLKSSQLSITLRLSLSEWLLRTDRDVAENAEKAFTESLDALSRLEKLGENPTLEETFDMLAESLQSCRVSDDRGDTSLDLQGWLEISYDPARHLVLAGMHEECVPDGTPDDAFVPDSLRESLGLRDSRGRFARDAFLLKSAVQSRLKQGRVDAVVARFNDQGEARKPARLLMRQSGEELAAIVSHLFAESSSTRSQGGAWQRDWQLDLPVLPNPYLEDSKSLSPSAIKDYLHCPLRFYLKRVVKMKTFEAGKREMNPMDFGNICHDVVDVFGKNKAVRNSLDKDEIAQFLSDTLDQEVRKQYGGRLSLPLMVQLESARERLRVFASHQVAERLAGWQIVETEFGVGSSDVPWSLSGQPMQMTVDRIDRHEDGVRWRVWDYKTSATAKEPKSQHIKQWKEEENRRQLAELLPPKDQRWADVQLPLYAVFVQEYFNTKELPEVGYIQLPKSVNNVGFTLWKDFDQALADHALTWAESAVSSILAGEFMHCTELPAAERDWDDFSELAPDGLEKAFDL